jgi:hypothetical protein
MRRPLQRGDRLAILLGAAVALFMSSLPFWVPLLAKPERKPYWSFGPEWSCTGNTIDPVCFRRRQEH